MTPEEIARAKEAGFGAEEIPAFHLTGDDAIKAKRMYETGFNEAEIAKAFNGKPNDPAPQASPQQALIDSMNPVEKGLVGVGKGMLNLGRGVVQKGMQAGEALGMLDPKTRREFEANIAEENKLYKPLADQSMAAKAGEFVGEVAPTVVIPGGITGGLLKRLGTSALAGAGMGAAQYTNPEDSTLRNMIAGATGGAVGHGATAAGSKLFNAIKNPAQNAVTQLSDKFGIRTTLGEATGNPLTKKAETWLEAIPVIGIKKFRQAQQTESESAAKRFLANYIVDPASPDAMATNRAYTSGLYDRLKTTVSGIQDQQIMPSETKAAANDLLKRYPDLFKQFQDTKTEGLLRNIAADTKDVTTVSPILNSQGNAISSTTPKTLTFDEAWALRDGLGEKIGQARKLLASGAIDQTQLSTMKRAFAAINKDIDGWADSIGREDVKGAIRGANDAYKQYVVKYDVIQRAMDKAEGTVGAGEMFSPKKLSTALKTIAYKDKQLNRFSPQEIDEMTGLANILQVTKRAGQYAENPPTGNRWGALGMMSGVGGGAMYAGGLPALGGVMSGTILTRFLTTTSSGKRLAMAASKIEPGTPAMEGLLRALPRAMAQESIDMAR